MNMVDLIEKKKRGQALSHEELVYFAQGAAKGTVPDYQLAALLMATWFNGMTPEETRDLTLAMVHTGEVADLSGIGGVGVDKHSTGGVGDTTTLVVAPLCAACGAKVAKMSGRGLGHTGGTLDKIESIPGASVDIPMDRFIRQVREIGVAVVGQTADLAPADKALFALRDVTGTVDCLPLIVSSIMSKKIASGAGAIVLDVKTGSGAIMHDLESSIELAKAMVEVGRLANRPTLALVTGMEQPLGTHVGNALEVKEAVDILAGRAGGRLKEVSLRLGAMMLVACGAAKDETLAREALEKALASGAGLEKLRRMIAWQGGDARVCDDTNLLPQAARKIPVPAEKSGWVVSMDAAKIGLASQRLGAGRLSKADTIDPAVGLIMNVELGDEIKAGQPLVTLYANEKGADEATALVREAIQIAGAPAEPPKLIYAVVRPEGVERF